MLLPDGPQHREFEIAQTRDLDVAASARRWAAHGSRGLPPTAFLTAADCRRNPVDSSLSVFSETRLSRSFLRTTPEKNPRTECCCQPVAFMIASIVVPFGCRQKGNHRVLLGVARLHRWDFGSAGSFGAFCCRLNRTLSDFSAEPLGRCFCRFRLVDSV